MKSKRLAGLIEILFVLQCIISCTASNKSTTRPSGILLQKMDACLAAGASQYRLMKNHLTAEQFPKNYNPQKDHFETSNSGWWCSGFYPGTLLLLYSQCGDKQLYDEALKKMEVLEKEKNNISTHDLGFMMYCSFGNAEKIAPKLNYQEVLLQSAKSLCTRFNPVVGCIKSWESKPSDFLVIIDNMMNLEMLFHETKISGDSSFYKIAVTHADNTMKNHYRPDYSCYHVVNYNPVTGAVQEKKTAQGAANESSWARGQAWGLYGFTMMYRETHEAKYLSQATGIANFLLNNPSLPADKIPYWDFDAPGIPSALRDASAAAIIADALLELCRYAKPTQAAIYFKAAETILSTLCSPEYFSTAGANDGFMLKHSVGHFPQGSEIDVSLSYADYYFTEAMIRYKAFKK